MNRKSQIFYSAQLVAMAALLLLGSAARFGLPGGNARYVIVAILLGVPTYGLTRHLSFKQLPVWLRVADILACAIVLAFVLILAFYAVLFRNFAP
jgi:hypothetical protein